MSYEKEYRVDVKIKNNLILEKIEQMGFKSLKSFCDANNVCYKTLHEILNFSKKPLTHEGKYRRIVHTLCGIFNCIPEELFSANQMETALETNKKTYKVNEAEMQFMLDNHQDIKSLEDQVLNDQMDKSIANILKTLTPREEEVIKMRMGLGDDGISYTLEEIGKKFDINRERVRQIEDKALSKMRHPEITGRLREFIEC